MLFQAGQNLDEIARAAAIIELMHQNRVPGVLAGPGRAGQRKHIRAANHPGGRARLNGCQPDLVITDAVKQVGETFNAFLEQRLQRFGRHIAPGQAGAAGGDDDVNLGIGDPLFCLGLNERHIVGNNRSGMHCVAGFFDALHQQ